MKTTEGNAEVQFDNYVTRRKRIQVPSSQKG